MLIKRKMSNYMIEWTSFPSSFLMLLSFISCHSPTCHQGLLILLFFALKWYFAFGLSCMQDPLPRAHSLFQVTRMIPHQLWSDGFHDTYFSHHLLYFYYCPQSFLAVMGLTTFYFNCQFLCLSLPLNSRYYEGKVQCLPSPPPNC